MVSSAGWAVMRIESHSASGGHASPAEDSRPGAQQLVVPTCCRYNHVVRLGRDEATNEPAETSAYWTIK